MVIREFRFSEETGAEVPGVPPPGPMTSARAPACRLGRFSLLACATCVSVLLLSWGSTAGALVTDCATCRNPDLLDLWTGTGLGAVVAVACWLVAQRHSPGEVPVARCAALAVVGMAAVSTLVALRPHWLVGP